MQAKLAIAVRDAPAYSIVHDAEIEITEGGAYVIDLPLTKVMEANAHFPGHSGLGQIEISLRFHEDGR